ncbi:heparinase II/III family protein [bacterium]|nr:heparinase II/III family protein [bacterium]
MSYSPHRVSCVFILCAVLFLMVRTGSGEVSDAEYSFTRPVDALRTEIQSGKDVARVNAVLDRARSLVDEPLVVREVEFPPEKYVGEPKHLVEAGKADVALRFLQAVYDVGASRQLAEQLPLLAAAYRLTGEKPLLDRIVAQLEEVLTWDPLQRWGWGGDNKGVWLATGASIQGLALTLHLLPEGALPVEILSRVQALLEREIGYVVDDWENKRPWYVKSHAVNMNQWVVPASGLVIACTALGRENHAEAYEYGIARLEETLAALGEEGAYCEGFTYAGSWTVPSLLLTGRFMAMNGDKRLLDHPFLKGFPVWYAHHFQPGRMLINCFDCWTASRNMYDDEIYLAPIITQVAALCDHPYLNWVIQEQLDGPAKGFYALLLLAGDPNRVQEPPLYGAYEHARRVNWRSSWADDASGVWVRGGHSQDKHDHHDRGHVNFTVAGQPVLIESGTPSYRQEGIKQMQSLVGHNVLQVGGETSSPKVHANIDVRCLDETGGEVIVHAAGNYEKAKTWDRDVAWDAQELTVKDRVAVR